MKNVLSFLNGIGKGDIIITVFHNDADGCCSCAIFDKFLEKRIGRGSDIIISQPMPPLKNLIQRIRLSMPTKIIFLDLGIDQKPSLVKKLENDCRILVIDHHQIMNDLNSRKTVHYNPLFREKVYLSASYLTYQLCSQIEKMDDFLWTSMIGIIGDYNTKDSTELVKKAKEMYPDIVKATDQESLHNSMFGQAAEMIAAAKACKVTCEEIVNILESSKNFEDVLQNSTLSECYRNVQQEIERVLIDAKSKIDTGKRVLFYEIMSRFNISSIISTKLSKEYPGKIIILWQLIGNKIKVSARNQSREFNVGRLLMEATKNMKYASAGGHDAAGGVSMRAEDWDEFVERINTITG